MNICKSAGGGISARTKSLREKFSSKRSYSELSFKDTLTSSTTSLSAASDSSRSGRSRHYSHAPTISEQGRQVSADFIKVGPISVNEFSTYNACILPEAAYCSALDINCQDGEPRFPWQRDVAIQCNLDDSHRLKPDSYKDGLKSPKSPNPSDKKSALAGFGSLRFWKSSSPLNAAVEAEKKQVPKKRPKSVLCRTASFDSRGYSRLIQQCSVPSSPTLSKDHTNELLVPDFSPNLVNINTDAPYTSSSPTASTVRSEDVGQRCPIATSAPQSRSSSPPMMSSSGPSSEQSDYSKFSEKILREKRKLYFLRKQPKSAPDSLDESSPPKTPPHDEKKSQPSNVFTFDTMQKLFDLKLRTKQSESKKGIAQNQKTMLLDIPTITAGGE